MVEVDQLADLMGIATIVVVVGLLAVFVSVNPRKKIPNSVTYELREAVLTRTEKRFYEALRAAVGTTYVVFAQVRVADVLQVPKGLERPRARTAFNRISSKHFDFLICEPTSYEIHAAVELDDKSHQRADQTQRDSFLNEAANSADLLLIRFEAQRTYDVDAIRATLSMNRLAVDPRLAHQEHVQAA